MDPLSLTASLIAILQLSSKVTLYLKQLKSGSRERIKFREEIRNITYMIQVLNDRIEDAEALGDDLASIKSLKTCGGPLDQLKNAFEFLAHKLASHGMLENFARSMLWPFSKAEVKDILNIIERQKSMLGLALENDQIGLSLAIKNQVDEVNQRFKILEIRQEDSEYRIMKEDDRAVVGWISPLNFWTRHQDLQRTRTEGTGEWILDSPLVSKWLSGEEKVIWCHGMPGAGKTVLASIIIDHLHRKTISDNIALVFIYCDYKKRSEQSHSNLISSILKQLIDALDHVPQELHLLYQRHLKYKTRPSRSEVLELVRFMTTKFPAVYIVIDALDECHDVDGTRSMLLKDLRQLLPGIQFLCTSRYLSDIDHQLEDYSRLELRANEADIRLYLRDRIEDGPRLRKHIQGDSTLLPILLDKIVQISDGMFLVAQLHINALATKHTRKALRSSIDKLPKKLDTMYEETVRRIYEQNQDDVSLAEKVLSWITFALTPLTVTALQHAVATMLLEEGSNDIDEDDLPDEDVLLAVCAGLVAIEKESNLIRLVHFTTQEYFERNRTTRRLDRYPLVRYAAQNWGNHARGLPEESCQEIIVEFLGNEALSASCSQAEPTFIVNAYTHELGPDWAQVYPRDTPPAVTVAKFGLTRIIKIFLSNPCALKAGDSFGFTPVIAAAKNGHEEMVLLLSMAGSDLENVTKLQVTALMAAAMRGHVGTMGVLLDHGAQVERQDSFGFTALDHATQCGQVRAVKILLEKGADFGSKGLVKNGWLSNQVDIIGLLARRQRALVNMTYKRYLGKGSSHIPISYSRKSRFLQIHTLLLHANKAMPKSSLYHNKNFVSAKIAYFLGP